VRLVKIARAIPWLIIIVLVVGWLVLLRPDYLGGATGYTIVTGDSMVPTLQPGDLAITRGQREYAVGDVVTFPVMNSIVIHRITGGTADDGFITRGDGTSGRDDTWRVPVEDIKGSLWFRVPGGGTYILNLLSFLRTPAVMVVLAVSISILLLSDVFRKARHRRLEIRKRRQEYFRIAGGG